MQSIEAIFEAFSSLKVLIIGDVMIDAYLWGKAERISPEAPVPIVHLQRKEQRLGGAANVALNIQALGATPILGSVIGKDKEADDFLALMQTANLSTEGILQSDARITTIKHRILAGSQQMLRIDAEIDTNLSEKDNSLLLAKIKSLMQGCDVVIFEDYDKGVLSEVLIQQVIALAKKQQIPTVVDPKKRNFLAYKHVTLFKPNLKELKEGLKMDLNAENLPELENAIAILQEKLGMPTILITLSEKGIMAATGEKNHLIPAHIRNIADVSGAGDTVIAIAALCVALHLPIAFMASLANLGGGLVCEHVGVVPIQKGNLFKEALQHHIFETYAD